MRDYSYIQQLKVQIDLAESELQQAFDMKKPFYEIKEIVQRVKLLINELATLEEHPLNAGENKGQ